MLFCIEMTKGLTSVHTSEVSSMAVHCIFAQETVLEDLQEIYKLA